MKLFTFGIFVITSISLLVCPDLPVLEQAEDFPEELIGQDYFPDNVRLERGLANWRELNFTNSNIESVRFYGFESFNDSKVVDHVCDEAETLVLLTEALNPRVCVRMALSDLDNARRASGAGDALGALQIKKSDGEHFIIGVGRTSFYCGVYLGTYHQRFYSPCLAQVVKRLGDKHCTQEISLELLENLAGIGVIDANAAILSKNGFTPFWEKQD